MKKSSAVLSILAIALICYFIVTLVSLKRKVRDEQQRIEQLTEEYASISECNSELREIVSNGAGEDYIERVARESYGYAMPDERVYYDS